MGRTIAYCRVSSRDQNPQLQLDALHAHGYDQLFAETRSATAPIPAACRPCEDDRRAKVRRDVGASIFRYLPWN
jgi:hypothetical protein